MKWTPEQITYLTNNMDTLSPQEISDVVGFTRKQVMSKIRIVKLNSGQSEITRVRFTESESELLKMMYPTTNVREMARILQMSEKRVLSRVAHLIRTGELERKVNYVWTDDEIAFVYNNIDRDIEFLMQRIKRPKSVVIAKRLELRKNPPDGNSEKEWIFDLRIGNRKKYDVMACGATEEYAFNRLVQGYRRVWNEPNLRVEKL